MRTKEELKQEVELQVLGKRFHIESGAYVVIDDKKIWEEAGDDGHTLFVVDGHKVYTDVEWDDDESIFSLNNVRVD